MVMARMIPTAINSGEEQQCPGSGRKERGDEIVRYWIYLER